MHPAKYRPTVTPRLLTPEVSSSVDGRERSRVWLALIVCFLAVTLAAPTGCLSQPRPRKELFALTAPAVAAPTPATSHVLEVREVQVSPLYEEKGFVYRLGDQAYESDPYAAFLVSPDQMFGAALRTHLRNTGLFLNVVETGSPVDATMSLKVEIVELYADFREEGSGQAVLSLRCLLYSGERGAPTRVLYVRDLVQRVPLEQRTPTAVVAGWDGALNAIIGIVEGELRPILTAERPVGSNGRTRP